MESNNKKVSRQRFATMASFQPTATPMRQIPGAFLNTPAPTRPDTVRRRLFSEQSAAGLISTTGGGSGPVAANASDSTPLQTLGQTQLPQSEAPLPPIPKAARSINQVLQLDESYPDLDSYCRRKPSILPQQHLIIRALLPSYPPTPLPSRPPVAILANTGNLRAW